MKKNCGMSPIIRWNVRTDPVGVSGFAVEKSRRWRDGECANGGRRVATCFMFFILLVFGGNTYATDTATSQVSSVSVHCSADKFKSFFDAFSENIQFQKQVIQLPLKKLIVIDADPEPRPVVKRLKKNQITFPVIPNFQERNNKGLFVRLETSGSNRAKAILFKEDTDYQVIFFFTRNGCWKLSKIEDWSL